MSQVMRRKITLALTIVSIGLVGLLPLPTEARRGFPHFVDSDFSAGERLAVLGDAIGSAVFGSPTGDTAAVGAAFGSPDCGWLDWLWGGCASTATETPASSAPSSAPAALGIDQRVIERVVVREEPADPTIVRALLERLGVLEADVARFEGSVRSARDYSPSSARRTAQGERAATDDSIAAAVSGGESAGSFTALDLAAPLEVNDGGTGTSTAPTFGQVLLGNAAGGYDLVATSSLGIVSDDSEFSTTSASYWDSTVARWATTSSDYWVSTKTLWSTTSANYFIAASSTIPHVGGSAYGDMLLWTGSAWSTAATSSLGIATSQWDSVSGGINYADGHVGVGTTSPYAKLAVHAFANATNSDTLFAVASSTPSATTTHFVVTSAGKVGIGTSTPSNALEIVGTGVGMVINRTGGEPYVTFALNSTNLAQLRGLTGGGLKFLSGASAEWARFDSSGNFGIGTTSPYAKLAVSALPSDTAAALFVVASSTASATTTHFAILNNGSVGVGTATPNAQFEIVGTRNPISGAATASNYPLIVQNQSNSNGASAGIGFHVSTGSGVGAAVNFIRQGSSGGGDLAFYTRGIGAGTLTERARFNSLGDFSVGTTSTSTSFTFQGVAGKDTFAIASSTGTQLFGVNAAGVATLGTAGTIGGKLVVGQAGSVNGNITIGGTANQVLSGTQNTLGITWQIVTDNSGSGGPAELRFGKTGQLSFGDAAANIGTIDANISRTSAGVLAVGTGTNGSTAGTLLAASIGLGTTTPGAKLHVLGTTEQLRLGYDASKYSSFTTGSTGGLTIASGGAGQNLTLSPSAGGGIVLIGGDFKEIGASNNPALVLDFGSDLSNAVTFLGTGGRAAAVGVAVGGVRVRSTFGYNFSSGDDTRATADTGIYRLATGTVAIGNGTAQNATGTLVAGRIGVGTTSPYAQLAVHAYNGATTTTLFVVASSTASATTTHFAILNNGNVGIGTSTPSGKLHVAGTSNSLIYFANGTLQAGAGGSSGFAFASLSAGTWTLGRPDGVGGLDGNTQVIEWQSNGVNSAMRGNVSFGTTFALRDTILSRSAVNTLRLSSDGSTGSANLIINGSVGIGTSTPAAKLVVQATNGDINIGTFDSSYPGISLNNTNGGSSYGAFMRWQKNGVNQWGYGMDATGTGGRDFWLYNYFNSKTGLYFEPTNAYLTLGTLSASASQLGVSGNAAVGAGYLATAAPTNGLLVQGNVGVGTTTPTSLYGGVFAAAGPIFVGGVPSTATSTFEGNVQVRGTFQVGTGSLYLTETKLRSSDGNLTLSSNSASNITNDLTLGGKLTATGLSSDATTIGIPGVLCLSSGNEVVKLAGVATCIVSSARFKHAIVDAPEGLGLLGQLRPVTFVYNGDDGSLGEQFGLIAEEVELVDPRLVVHDAAGLPFSVRYENLTAVLITGIQELDAKIEGFASWFGEDGSFRIQGDVCVDDVCVSKEQFKEILLDGGGEDSGAAGETGQGGGAPAAGDGEEPADPVDGEGDDASADTGVDSGGDAGAGAGAGAGSGDGSNSGDAGSAGNVGSPASDDSDAGASDDGAGDASSSGDASSGDSDSGGSDVGTAPSAE